jgi:Uma2 family endonuclease
MFGEMNAPLIKSPVAQRAPLSAPDFWLLAEAGAFNDYAKTELIEGELWVVNSVWAWHARTTAHLSAELLTSLRSMKSELTVYHGGSLNVSNDTVPEPDVSVGKIVDTKGLPLDACVIAIEVSESSIARDLGLKSRLYGTAGVPEYWVVDRDGARVVQMWSPITGGYANRADLSFGETVESIAVPGLIVGTAEFPR